MGPEIQDNNEQVLNSAMRFIKLRFHTQAELRRKLKIRHFREEDIEKTIKHLVSLGLINDAQFAEVFLDNLIRYKSWGFYGLLSKLLARGIDRGMAEQLLYENLTLEKEEQIARRLIGEKSGNNRMKTAQSLKSRGFRAEVISKIIKDLDE
ncbi:MAG TPA: RecX family transcriptional regulator [Patescibacteria group bacterium]|jgi:regulatory protein|nr:RecX family transcriptional regulator [Patescibacteria group bacterium]